MGEVLPEAHELVEEGLITTDDFRDFVFGNAARFWTNGQPRFLQRHRVETQVKDAALMGAAK